MYIRGADMQWYSAAAVFASQPAPTAPAGNECLGSNVICIGGNATPAPMVTDHCINAPNVICIGGGPAPSVERVPGR